MGVFVWVVGVLCRGLGVLACVEFACLVAFGVVLGVVVGLFCGFGGLRWFLAAGV